MTLPTSPIRRHWLAMFWPVALVTLLVAVLNGGVLAYLSRSYLQANAEQQTHSSLLVVAAHLNVEIAAIQLLASDVESC